MARPLKISGVEITLCDERQSFYATRGIRTGCECPKIEYRCIARFTYLGVPMAVTEREDGALAILETETGFNIVYERDMNNFIRSGFMAKTRGKLNKLIELAIWVCDRNTKTKNMNFYITRARRFFEGTRGDDLSLWEMTSLLM